MTAKLRSSALIATVLSVIAICSGPALAAPAGTVLAQDIPNPAHTDGHGLVAWVSTPGTVHVLDVVTDRSFDVDVRGDCLTPPTKVAAVGGGKVLYLCPRQADPPHADTRIDEPRLLDVATRAIYAPPGTRTPLEQALDSTFGSGEFNDVGLYGLRFQSSCYHCGLYTGLLDWRTGSMVSGTGTATSIPDLDRPELFTTLCRPLVRPSFDDADAIDANAFDDFAYEPPYAVWAGPRTPLTLQRCGSSRTVRLWPLGPFGWSAFSLRVSAGFISWTTSAPQGGGALPHGYLPECRARLDWPFGAFLLQHLPGALVRSDQQGNDGPWTVRRIPLSGVCAQLGDAESALLAGGGRIAVAAPLAVRVADARSDAMVTLLRASRPRPGRLPIVAGRRLALTLRIAARSVRWQVGGGRWHAASGRARSWALRAPRLDRPHTLSLDVRFAQGGSARFAVALRPARP